MSFENHLPHTLISKLYKNVLYNIPEKGFADETLSHNAIPFWGGNEKQIVIIVNYKTEAFIPSGQLKFLLDILSACRLRPDDVAIINTATTPGISIEGVTTLLSPKIIIAFNVSSSELMPERGMLPLMIHQVNNISFVFAPALEIIEGDVALKKQFWLILRKLFEV